MTVADLMRGLLLASANDAAATLAVRVGGTRARFVRLMNRRARALGLRDTHYSNPIGLDQPGNHSSAEDLVKLTLILRATRSSARSTNLPSATLKTGARQRTITNRNTLVRSVRAVNGVKTGHTSTAGYVLVGSATPRRRHGRLGRARRAQRGRARRRLARRSCATASTHYHRLAATVKGRTYASAKLAHRDARVKFVATRTVRRTVRRGEHYALRILGAPRQVDGPLPPARGWGRSRCAGAASRSTGSPLVTRGSGGGRDRRAARRAASSAATLIVLAVAAVALGSLRSCCCAAACSVGAGAAPGEPRSHDHHRHPQRGDRQVAVRAELPARPAASHRGADDDAGRQGRQRRADAEDARPARDRDRLRGRPDRHPDRRAAHGGVDPQRLRAHPRGVADEHGRRTTRRTARRPRSTSAARP